MSNRALVVVVVGALLVAVVLFGLLGIFLLPWLMSDPPPDPATAPLEIVANDAANAVCILNREAVGAGLHEVHVIAEQEPATVELRDPTGQVVYRQEGDTSIQGPEEGPSESEGEAVPPPEEEGPGSVALVAGDYTVVCSYDGGRTREVPLAVTP